MLRFGPFELDERTWSLSRDGAAINLSPRLVEILHHLASRPGEIVTKDELLTDKALPRAMAEIRKALGDRADTPQFIETVARRGYRFVAQVGPAVPGSRLPAPDGDPFHDWVKGRLALESLDLRQLPRAVSAFERSVAELPSYAPAYAGLANAYLVEYETTRFGNIPDRDLLDKAITAARRACATDASLAEGWAVLGYLLAAAGDADNAKTAARRAAALEPDNWRHQFRLGYVAWGEERLRAANRVLTLMPAFAPARMLSATVFVARGALARAEHEVAAGAEAPLGHRGDDTPVPAAGLHWLKGLVLSARGENDAALASFGDEITAGTHDHVYFAEFTANARVAAGFCLLSLGRTDEAAGHFSNALKESKRHARATLGAVACCIQTGEMRATEASMKSVDQVIGELQRGGRPTEAALVAAGRQVVLGRVTDAIDVLERLLSESPAGSAGWIIPVDPMLAAVRFSHGRSRLLAKLADRAS